jgi:hypothetical protein
LPIGDFRLLIEPRHELARGDRMVTVRRTGGFCPLLILGCGLLIEWKDGFGQLLTGNFKAKTPRKNPECGWTEVSGTLRKSDWCPARQVVGNQGAKIVVKAYKGYASKVREDFLTVLNPCAPSYGVFLSVQSD